MYQPDIEVQGLAGQIAASLQILVLHPMEQTLLTRFAMHRSVSSGPDLVIRTRELRDKVLSIAPRRIYVASNSLSPYRNDSKLMAPSSPGSESQSGGVVLWDPLPPLH